MLNKSEKRKETIEKMKNEIEEMVKNMDRQMLEDTIKDWENKPELLPYMDYLRQKKEW
jgi:exonuclease VII small subunit